MAQSYQRMIDDGTYRFKEIQDSANAYFQNRDKGRGSGYKNWKRWEYQAKWSLNDSGFVNGPGFYSTAFERYNQQLNQNAHLSEIQCNGDWRSLGPEKVTGLMPFDPGIGRLTSVAIDPNNEKHMLVGSQTGGVWKTLNGGDTWTPISDFMVNLRVYSLAIDPFDSDIYYWGVSHGTVFKSTNAGNTWKEIEFDGRGHIHQIKTNMDKEGELFLTDTYKGIFKSSDKGETWVQVLDGKCYDIERHPKDTGTLYASGHGLWKSKDGGNTFTQVSFPYGNNQPIMIAVSAHAPNNVYALQSVGKIMEGLYLSRDTGFSFQKVNLQGKNLLGYSMQGTGGLGQAPRNMDIAVSNTDSNEIYVAGINIWRSLNAAESFSIVSHHLYSNSFPTVGYTHADIEVLLYDKLGRLWVCSDGGLYRMDAPGSKAIDKSSFENVSNGLGVQQIYRLGISQSDPCIISVGAQDNGSAVYKDGIWHHYHGGDGTETVIIDNKRHTLFASSQNGSFVYSEDGKTSKPVQGLYTKFGSGKWVTPFEKDPNDTNTVYAGYDKVYRSTDLGKTFEEISQEFHPSHIKVAPTGSDTIYAASAYFLYRTTDGGKTKWDRLLYGNATRYEINSITIHPQHADWVALAVAGSTKFLITKDGGETWTQWKENLPAYQSLTTVWQNDTLETLYLGLEAGVFYRNKNMNQWEPFTKGLPNVKVSELEINEVTQEIYAATYGRGVWVSPLCGQQSVGLNDAILQTKIIMSPNPLPQNEPLRLQIDLPGTHEVRLFDVSGQMKYQGEVQHLVEIETQHLAPGLYFVRIQTHFGTVTNRLVVH